MDSRTQELKDTLTTEQFELVDNKPWVQSIWDFTDYLLKRRIPGARVNRNAIQKVQDNSYRIPVFHEGRHCIIFHDHNPRWTKEKNAWEIAAKVHKKIKLGAKR